MARNAKHLMPLVPVIEDQLMTGLSMGHEHFHQWLHRSADKHANWDGWNITVDQSNDPGDDRLPLYAWKRGHGYWYQ